MEMKISCLNQSSSQLAAGGNANPCKARPHSHAPDVRSVSHCRRRRTTYTQKHPLSAALSNKLDPPIGRFDWMVKSESRELEQLAGPMPQHKEQ
ncbi:hypothetical protein C4D60_Mb06t32680 [Musa balbisiana]|uniref:Uncharacterized protein n=1 Tax=Musa balbisiana TaxID=52838 RepID=A0A4V6T457_MUSBA|nr:hypothetical protein C4D60_Mb06t32680 [Musa balbisiana]